jgi:DNA-binding CsgD family transcriptional regulator
VSAKTDDVPHGVLLERNGRTFLLLSLPQPRLDLTLLTCAELEVVAEVLRARSNARIARDRGRSPRTIANQLAAIFRKLRVGSRAELAARVRANDVADLLRATASDAFGNDHGSAARVPAR